MEGVRKKSSFFNILEGLKRQFYECSELTTEPI